MAEFVNQRLEDMVLELEQLKRIEIYSADEIRDISKKRKEFEYKIHRKTRCKEDFLRYIAYECLLMHNIRLRREKFSIEEKKNDIEYVIAKRVSKLYKELIARFSGDIEIWLSYMKFSKRVNFLHNITTYLEKLLQIHGDKPKIWQLACRWEYEEMNNIKNARKIILKGIHRHPEYADLYIDIFRIELLVAEALANEEREKQLERANVILENALKKIDDVNFVVKLCTAAADYDFTNSILKRLFSYLWEKYSSKIESWNFVASFELQNKEVEGFDWRSLSDLEFSYNYPLNIANYVNVYETALTKEDLEDACLNYIYSAMKLSTSESCDTNIKFQIVNRALSKGHSLGKLNEDLYKIWLNILCLENKTSRDEIQKILKEACLNLPSSEYIWGERLKRTADNNNELFKIFKLARESVPADNITSIWAYVIETVRDIEKLKKLYEESIILPPKVAATIKPVFLKSFYEYGNLTIAREQYILMARCPPLVSELHSTMMEIECAQNVPDIKNWRNCHELATQQFGTKSPEVWLNYVKFEMENGHPERCGLLYSRACSYLDRHSVDVFVSNYSLIK